MNKKIKFIIIIAIIIVIVAVFGCAIYFRGVIKNQQSVNTNDNYIKYSNKETGISFVYPKWWGDVYLTGVSSFPDAYLNFRGNTDITIDSTNQLANQMANQIDTNCPTEKNYTSTAYSSIGSSNDDFIYCEETQSKNGLVMQLFTGADSIPNQKPAYYSTMGCNLWSVRSRLIGRTHE